MPTTKRSTLAGSCVKSTVSKGLFGCSDGEGKRLGAHLELDNALLRFEADVDDATGHLEREDKDWVSLRRAASRSGVGAGRRGGWQR